MFTLLLFLLLTAVGSAALGVHLRRALGLERSTGALSAAVLLVLCLQSAFAVFVGAYASLRLAGLLWAVLQCCAIGAILIDGRFKKFAGMKRTGPGRFQMLFVVIAVFMLAVTFVSALAPVTAWDAGVAHLAVAARYADDNRVDIVPGNNYSAYPQLMQTLFALALNFRVPRHDEGGHAGFVRTEKLASVTAWFFGVLACASAYALGMRLGGSTSGAIAMANLAAAPIFADQAVSPSIDLAFTAIVVAALSMLFAWHEEQRWGQLAMAAALAGSGCGIRHTGYLVVMLFTVGIVLWSRERRLSRAALFALVSLLFASPWLWHSWRIAGDPFYPFFASRWSNGLLPDVDVAAVGTHSSLQGGGVLRLLVFPWSLTMNPAHYGGWATSPGAVWLLLGLVGVVVGGGRARVTGAFSGAGLTVIFFFQRFARYAFPFLAPMMVVAALPVENLPRLRKLIVASLLVSYVLGVVPAVANAARRLPVVVGSEPRDAYLAERVERYAAMDWLAQNAPADAKILSVDPRGYYFNRAVFTNFEALKGIARLDKDHQYEWLRSRNIRYLFYPEAYVKGSPGFRETGVGAMLDAWRADPAHFTAVKTFDLPNPRMGGSERVEIYEFRP